MSADMPCDRASCRICTPERPCAMTQYFIEEEMRLDALAQAEDAASPLPPRPESLSPLTWVDIREEAFSTRTWLDACDAMERAR